MMNTPLMMVDIDSQVATVVCEEGEDVERQDADEADGSVYSYTYSSCPSDCGEEEVEEENAKEGQEAV